MGASFVLKKAGVEGLDIQQLLTDFLGDVQIVADFGEYRQQILAHFGDVMNSAIAGSTDTELYLVAHSEGSVITFLTLLEALDDPGQHPWIRAVKGLMTIGSPRSGYIGRSKRAA